jgi:hypothetical protein
MRLLEDKTEQLDDLLAKMAEDIQLDESRRNRMLKSYEAVKAWIEDDETFFKPYKYDIYPHGSVRILTANKPLHKDEFDLDVAIHLKLESTRFTPSRIYAELKRRLEENEVYKKILEVKNRCIRLNYSGDFHMDILPGIQEDVNDPNRLKVPDRELGSWVSSNPRGYADWFIGKSKITKKTRIMDKAFTAEKLPVDDFKSKKPLQIGVQLIKRYRDLHFQDNDEYRTSSIILTTLAGQYYKGEETIFDTIDGVVSSIQAVISSSPSRIQVLNPVNEDEDFTDKWDEDPRYYEAFKKFCNYFFDEWQKLKQDNGVLPESRILKSLFGDELFSKAQTNQALMLEKMRREKSLGVSRSTGILTSALAGVTSAVKGNTFYGE